MTYLSRGQRISSARLWLGESKTLHEEPDLIPSSGILEPAKQSVFIEVDEHEIGSLHDGHTVQYPGSD